MSRFGPKQTFRTGTAMSALGGVVNRSRQLALSRAEKTECMRKPREFFQSFIAAKKPGTFGWLASRARPWASNPNRKNEIECCVDRLNRQTLADITVLSSRCPLLTHSGHHT